jgi:hypothetical protein
MTRLSANVTSDFDLSQERKAVVEEALGTWAFSAHDYTDDELLYGALVMLKHALQMPELDKWRIPEGMYDLSANFASANVQDSRPYCFSPCESYGV